MTEKKNLNISFQILTVLVIISQILGVNNLFPLIKDLKVFFMENRASRSESDAGLASGN